MNASQFQSAKTRRILDELRRYECRNVTYIEEDGSWPIVWERAAGMHVWDADGRKYLDLTAAFGVAAAGHANPRVVRAGQKQMSRLLHAMGDVHPHELKAKLARKLSRITFERWSVSARPRKARGSTHTGKAIFCNSGFEAVEAALKTAMLATGKPGIIAFEGGYHGLGYGALNATQRSHFRGPFRSQLAEFGEFAAFPQTSSALGDLESRIKRVFRRHRIGAILVEPIQVRGGIRIPPHGFLRLLRRACDEHRALLILDEIYTGFGRTGKWFACEHESVTPDLVCLGKAMTGGFPLSACVGRSDLMDAAWPVSTGEAIHTSTFLGHPVGCAMALAQIDDVRRDKLVERSNKMGNALLGAILAIKPASPKIKFRVRGRGLLAGLELMHSDGSPATSESLRVVKEMLHAGYILLPEGEHASVISFTPPLIINSAQIQKTARALQRVVARSLSNK